MSHQDNDDDVPQLAAQMLGTRRVLASACLDASLTTAQKQRIMARPTLVVVNVPSAQWSGPVDAAIERAIPGIEVARFSDQRRSNETTSSTTLRKFGEGRSVAVISHADNLVQAEIIQAADQTIAIESPNPTVIRRVLRQLQTGPIPKTLNTIDLGKLDFDAIAACITPGLPAKVGVSKLKAAVDAPSRVKTRDGVALPTLAGAVEYGEAREWALNLRTDFADLKRGLIGPHDIDRGCLLFGPPGTGKSLLAEIIGEACGVPVHITSLGDMFSKGDGHLGDVLKAQRQVFQKAASSAPCILFLDEINALPNIERLDSKNREWWSPVILDFMLMLDSAVSSRDGLVVIGATNRPDDVSPALLRPGRLERKLFVGPPNKDGLHSILRRHLGHELEGADLTAIIQSAVGATGAEVMLWVRHARRTARRNGRSMVIADLEDAVGPVVNPSAKLKWRIAVHEAGHALAGLVLDDDVRSVSIGVQGISGGQTEFGTPETALLTGQGLEDRLVALLAAHAAEVEIFGKASLGSGGGETSDLARATTMVAMTRESYGMGDNLAWLCPPEKAMDLMQSSDRFATIVNAELMRLYDIAKRLVSKHRVGLLAVAGELVTRGHLSADEARNIARLHPPEALAAETA